MKSGSVGSSPCNTWEPVTNAVLSFFTRVMECKTPACVLALCIFFWGGGWFPQWESNPGRGPECRSHHYTTGEPPLSAFLASPRGGDSHCKLQFESHQFRSSSPGITRLLSSNSAFGIVASLL